MKQYPSQQKAVKAKVNKRYHKRIKSFNEGEGFRKGMRPSEKAFVERIKAQARSGTQK